MPSCQTNPCLPDIPVPTPDPLPPCEDGEPCGEVTDAKCVIYLGPYLNNLDIRPFDRLDAIIQKWATVFNSNAHAIVAHSGDSIAFSGTGLDSNPLLAEVRLHPDTHNLIKASPDGLITLVDLCLLKDLATLVNSNAEAHELFCEMIEGCASGHCGTAVGLQLVFNGQQLQLTWTPFQTNVSSQVVQFKRLLDVQWSSQTNVHPSVSTATIPTIYINSVYQVRIQNICLIGGPSFNIPSTISTAVCPVPQIISSYDNVTFSFNYEVRDYDKLIVTLMGPGNVPVATRTFDCTVGTMQLISGVFSNLDVATNYSIVITMKTHLGDFYTKVCPAISTSTEEPPTCTIPSNLQVTIQ